jgi:hypothetical protein
LFSVISDLLYSINCNIYYREQILQLMGNTRDRKLQRTNMTINGIQEIENYREQILQLVEYKRSKITENKYDN